MSTPACKITVAVDDESLPFHGESPLRHQPSGSRSTAIHNVAIAGVNVGILFELVLVAGVMLLFSDAPAMGVAILSLIFLAQWEDTWH